jgi:hypothetical protein
VKGDARINRTKPGPGRFPKRFEKWCQKQILAKQVRKATRKILKNPEHRHHSTTWRNVAAYAAGQPKQSVDIGGKLTLEELVAGANEPDQEEKQ